MSPPQCAEAPEKTLSKTTPAMINSIPTTPARFSDSRQSSIPATTAPAVPSPDQMA